MKKVITISMTLILLACEPAKETTPADVANFYGVCEFDKVREISFTFNVKLKGDTINRSWKWRPKENTVLSIAKNKVLGYNRSTITSGEIEQLDQQFINDSYWLLFPYHLMWDKGFTYEFQSGVESPIHRKLLNKLVVSYDNRGYSPGDVYELYLSEQGEIKEWIYRKGGAPEPTRLTTWEGNQGFDELLISTMHEGKDDSFRVWFTDIVVKRQN